MRKDKFLYYLLWAALGKQHTGKFTPVTLLILGQKVDYTWQFSKRHYICNP